MNDVPDKNRRSFLSALLGEELAPQRPDPQVVAGMAKRASVLALKYGKNTLGLSRIAVRSPDWQHDALYQVEISGADPEGISQKLILLVDAESDTIEPKEENTETAE